MTTDSATGVGPAGAALPSSQALERVMQRRLFDFGLAFLALLLPLYIGLWLHEGRTLALSVVLALSALLPLLAWWVHRRGDHAQGLVLLHSATFVGLLVMVLRQPGVGTPHFWWFSVVPFVSLLCGLVRLGLVQGAVVIAVALADELLQPAGAAVDGFRLHLAVVLSTAYVCGHLAFSVRGWRLLQRANDEAQRAALASTEAKARFLANISHEIRTPLGGVIGAAEMLRSPQLPDAQRLQLAALQEQSAKTLLALVNDILDWSKLGAGRLRVEAQPVALRSLVFEANELFAGAAFDKGIELTSSCDPRVPRLLEGDPTRLRQVVNNLVSNAVKFTHEGGVHIDLAPDDGVPAAAGQMALRIEVADSGIGIAAEHLPQLFTAFHQGDDTVARRYGGTGLGLSICRELVRLMGGRIEVSSQPARGSRFTVHLAMKVLEAADAPRPAGPKVLLAARSDGLVCHLQSLLDELGSPVLIVDAPPPQLQGATRLLVDLPIAGTPAGLEQWLAFARQHGLAVALLVPLGGDAVAGLVPGASLVYKPVRRAALAAFLGSGRAAAAPADDGAAPRVLVVDDNPVNQLIVQAMLAEIGARCTLAGSGEQALAHQQGERFDLVLMDMQMPGLDGLETAREWRRREAAGGAAPLPIVAMSAHSEADAGAACSAAGMNGYLGKPFGIAALRRCLEEQGVRPVPGSAPSRQPTH